MGKRIAKEINLLSGFMGRSLGGGFYKEFCLVS
jgi:hypothetical protein